jgi:hypothetical protein
MKAIKFPEVNHTYAENQPEYNQLPGLKFKSKEGEFVFCMKLALWERIYLLFTGKLWVCFLTFNKPLTPSLHTVRKSDVIVRKAYNVKVEE